MTTTNYILSNTAEADRLQVQARVWEPDVELLLDQIGVRPGWSCLDLGCGAIGILEPLSRRVGPEGRIVGVDNDPRLLLAARAYVQQADLANVEILERDAFDTALPSESFDLVHARFVMAFGRGGELLREMRRLVKPGGMVASQETDQNSWDFFPRQSVWPRLKQTIEAAFIHMGGDANMGQQTYGMFRGAGLEQLIGLAFLLGPELGLTLWPTPIPLALMRFIGAIVFANGVGALMIVGRPTWENARVLFTVALVYGIVVLLALLYQLLVVGAAPLFWAYVLVDTIFLIPIGAIFWTYERASAPRPGKQAPAMSGGQS